MYNDNSKLMNEVSTVASILVKDVDETKLMLRLEEILSNYDIKRKTEVQLEEDLPEKIELFIDAKRLEGLSILTLQGYWIELNMFHKYLNKATVQINTVDIRKYLSSNSEWSPGTIEKKLSVIKTFFGWLVNEEVILKNPASKVKSPKQPKRLPKGLGIEEMEILRESCVDNRERALIETLYATGCRLAELVNMKVTDINFNENSAKIIGKGNKERVVYFTFKSMYHLKKYINERKGNSEYVFCSIRHPYNKVTGRSIERLINKISARTSIKKNIHPHIFRHTMATHMMENGAELADVQHILGHDNPSTTLVYSHVSEERKKQAHKRFLVS